jgi:hypothetical protein
MTYPTASRLVSPGKISQVQRCGGMNTFCQYRSFTHFNGFAKEARLAVWFFVAR